MPDTRLVWLTHADVSWLHTSADTPQRAEALMRLNIGFNSAPADAVAAARSALTDCEYRSIHGCEPEPLHDLYQPEGCRIIRADAVLRALGIPEADA